MQQTTLGARGTAVRAAAWTAAKRAPRLAGAASLAWALALLALPAALLLSSGPSHAQSGSVWRIDYFPNDAWAGAPVYTDYSGVLNFNWGARPPGPRLPATNWTARMTTETFFYAGVYRLTLIADDEFAVSVDGVAYFDTFDEGQAGKGFVVDIPFEQGVHRVAIDFRQYTGPAYLSLDWYYLKRPRIVLTPVVLATPAPSSQPAVVTRYGDFTRCIQQGLHQAHCFQSSGQWDSPNLGSIETEPQIVVWGNCTADQVTVMQLYAGAEAQPAKCSKTEAGWYPD